ncbi:MAG: hypothetical protein PHP02_08880 [Eubacteriales bacterium]|nr:hypothetical protein [Eubacteriales bacterium]
MAAVFLMIMVLLSFSVGRAGTLAPENHSRAPGCMAGRVAVGRWREDGQVVWESGFSGGGRFDDGARSRAKKEYSDYIYRNIF